MAESDSDSSSSSSSSSSDEESAAAPSGVNCNEEAAPADAGDVDVDDAHHEDGPGGHRGEDDSRKAFLSRIPQAFDEDAIKRLLEEGFGEGCVEEVGVVRERSDDADADAEKDDAGRKGGKEEEAKHRGFGFVTFSTEAACRAAVEAGTVRGAAKATGKRKRTLYIRPVVRDGEDVREDAARTAEDGNKNVCFLWKKYRCPYGEECKFAHEGEGGCVADAKTDGGDAKKKRQKCFAFRKGGKCKLGGECPYSHDVVVANKHRGPAEVSKEEKRGSESGKEADKSQKDCINWMNKGKCRKKDRCPYRHDPSVREKVLAKKQGKEGNASDKKPKREKNRQSLSVRVFGLNYDTTADDIQAFFAHCGPIVEVTFPTFDDSGRSKGYCGVLFQSPKAVALAVELDGKELHGRWLRIQEGKMYLRQWEEGEQKREAGRKRGKDGDGEGEGKEEAVGEYGQRVKRRKRHGFKE